MPTQPWCFYYHCTTSTYGTWLRGDARGWRARHHREHVDGDYKRPPPKGIYDRLHAYSKRLMKRDPVRLEYRAREVALEAIVKTLLSDSVDVLVSCLDGIHLHVLGRFRDKKPRQRLGWAKLEATKRVKAWAVLNRVELGLKQGEGLWAKRSKNLPVKDKAHRDNTLLYIADHEQKGAVVYVHPPARKVLETLRQKRQDRNRRRAQ